MWWLFYYIKPEIKWIKCIYGCLCRNYMLWYWQFTKTILLVKHMFHISHSYVQHVHNANMNKCISITFHMSYLHNFCTYFSSSSVHCSIKQHTATESVNAATDFYLTVDILGTTATLLRVFRLPEVLQITALTASLFIYWKRDALMTKNLFTSVNAKHNRWQVQMEITRLCVIAKEQEALIFDMIMVKLMMINES